MDTRNERLKELATLFLKLGTVAFGGPAAHIALMEEEVVKRRGWISRQEFLDLLGATNLIPGPNSTELAIHIGHRRAGFPGLLTAGICFILPAMAIVWTLAWAYVKWGTLPSLRGLLDGVTPVILAIVTLALWRLGKTALRTPLAWILALMTGVGCALGGNEISLLFGAGTLAILLKAIRPGAGFGGVSALVLSLSPWLMGASPSLAATPHLFLLFAKIGSVLFGSGYVLLAFLQSELVERWGYLSSSQLLDAVAVGQVTPGPVFTTATFVGYLVAGNGGAVAATVGIFLPAFFFVAISGPLVPRLRRSPWAAAFLDAVNAASVALMAWVTWELARSSLGGALSLGIYAVALVGMARLRWSSVVWIALGGGIGVGRSLL